MIKNKYTVSKFFYILTITTLIFTLIFSNSLTVFAAEQKKYVEYLDEYNLVLQDGESLVLKATEYERGNDISVNNNFLYTSSESSVTYRINVPKTGLYHIVFTYKPIAGGGDIIRKIRINSKYPFKEAENIILKRYYKDADYSYKEQKGNQIFPSQVECEVWMQLFLSDPDSHDGEPLMFFLESGENTLTIEGVEGDICLDNIIVSPATKLPDYKTYISKCNAEGYEKYNGDAIKVQGEDAVLKTSPSLYPINDRTSPLIEPYNKYYVVLNAIGGEAWRFPGQEIIWEVEAPKTGLYKLAFKYKQSLNRGSFSTRRLKINGQVPFREANDLRFYYDTKFNIIYLSDSDSGEEFYFLLHEGINTISLESCTGIFSDFIERVEGSLDELNKIYQDIIVVTGVSPDKYRDYKITALIPDIKQRLISERNNLQDIVDDMLVTIESFTNSISIINMLIVDLNRIIDRPNEIGRYLTSFKSNISALGNWITAAREQPLEIDYFMLTSADCNLPRAEGNFWERRKHGIYTFIGSFLVDFDTVVGAAKQKTDKTIEVWVSTGRDQYNILQKMIDESFCKKHGINVVLKLVNTEAVFPATLTGNGPDVIIQVGASLPINFGYRNSAYDLTKFPDFNDIANRFAPAAINTFMFRDECYALPDQMSFNMMFYRTDIFKELGLEVPKTMDELLDIVPVLQKNNMDIFFETAPQQTLGAMATSGSTKNVNPVYMSLLLQNGGQLYMNEGEKIDITSDSGVKTFKYWTDLYTKHNFLVTTDFMTRFRMGEIPIGVVDFTMFNSLSVGAPEIKGDWEMVQIPGTLQDDGSIRYDTPVTVSGSLIVENIAEKNGTVDESWEFLKWWTSAETQYNFAIQMESILGLAGRYPVANLEAFEKIAWGKSNLEELKKSIKCLQTVPQVPGSYITGRVIENAFLEVVTEDTTAVNPVDILYDAADEINKELKSKRIEFGIE